MVKALGLNWNTNIDALSLSLTKLIKETNSTEKSLQEISIKLILKSLRPVGICGTSHSKSENNDAGTMETQPNMGQELPDSFKENWIKWPNKLQSLTLLEKPRQFFNNVASEVQLHVFCYSSQLAYGAVAYLRGSSPKSETHCTFVISVQKQSSTHKTTNNGTIRTTCSSARSRII